MTMDIAKPLQKAVFLPLQRSQMLVAADCIYKHSSGSEEELAACQKKAMTPLASMMETVARSTSQGGVQAQVQNVQQRCADDLKQEAGSAGGQPPADAQEKFVRCMHGGLSEAIATMDVAQERNQLVQTCEEAIAPFSGWPSADVTGSGGGLGKAMTGTGWAAAKSGGSSSSSFGLW